MARRGRGRGCCAGRAALRWGVTKALSCPPDPRENPWLIGHAAAEASLLDALRRGRLHHAWLIAGPEGVGKATLAYRFARRLLAGGAATLEMAPGDAVFRRVAAGTHADLLTIEREWDEKKKRLKKQIAADSVRAIGAVPASDAGRGWLARGGAGRRGRHEPAIGQRIAEDARGAAGARRADPGVFAPGARSCRRCAAAAACFVSRRWTMRTCRPRSPTTARRCRLRTGRRCWHLPTGAPGRALALAGEGGLAIAAMVTEILAGEVATGRGYEMADSLRDQAAFETFMSLLQQRIAAAVKAAVAGGATTCGAARWAALVAALQELGDETERANMNRRQAVLAGLSWIKQEGRLPS